MRRLGWLLAMAACGAAAAQTNKAAVEEVTVEGTHLEQTSRCNKGGAIRVAATESRLSILGDCTQVIIDGGSNWILVEHAKTIVMHGSRNTVLYQDRSTRVSDKGRANSVSEKWQQ